MDTVARGEAELDRLIERRSGKERDPDEREDLWKDSVGRYNEQRRLQSRYEWHLHHVGQADRLRRTLEDLIAFHEAAAEKLLDEGRSNEATDTGAA